LANVFCVRRTVIRQMKRLWGPVVQGSKEIIVQQSVAQRP
jgi:hypothetical protein